MADGNGDGSDRPIVLLPNGMVRIDLGTPDEPVEVMWRRPKIGELRRFDEAAGAVDDEVSRMSKETTADHVSAQERWEAAKGDYEQRLDDAEDLDERDTVRREKAAALAEHQAATLKRNRVLFQRRDEAWAGWYQQVDASLNISKQGLPEDPDEMPAMLLDEKLVGDLLNHWRTRPFRSVGDG